VWRLYNQAGRARRVATDNVVCFEAGMALEKMPGGQAFEAKYEKRFGRPFCTMRHHVRRRLHLVDAMKRGGTRLDPSKNSGSNAEHQYVA